MKTRARGTKARLLVVLGLLFVAVLVTVVLQKKQETAPTPPPVEDTGYYQPSLDVEDESMLPFDI